RSSPGQRARQTLFALLLQFRKSGKRKQKKPGEKVNERAGNVLDPIEEVEIDALQPSGVLAGTLVDRNLRRRAVEEWNCPCRCDPDHDDKPDKMCRMNKN